MRFFDFESLLGKKQMGLSKDEKDDRDFKSGLNIEEKEVDKLIDQLENLIRKEGRDPNNFDIPELRETFKRKNDIMRDTDMMFMLFRMADALAESMKMNKERGNRPPNATDLLGILMVMLVKLERDNHIKLLTKN